MEVLNKMKSPPEISKDNIAAILKYIPGHWGQAACPACGHRSSLIEGGSLSKGELWRKNSNR